MKKNIFAALFAGVLGGIIIEKKFEIANKVIKTYNDIKSKISAKIKSEAEDFEDTK